MPSVIQGASSGSAGNIEYIKDHTYKYPLGNNLAPNTQLHSQTVRRLMDYCRISTEAMDSKHRIADKIDQQLTSYVVLNSKERGIKNEDARKPLGIVIPTAITILDTLQAHTANAYLGRPIFHYTPDKPEDKIAAMLYELAVQKHMQQSKSLLAVLSASRDAYAYGLGVLTPVWRVHRGTKLIKTERPAISPISGAVMDVQTSIEEVRNAVLREGSALEHIDFRSYRPDPGVAHDRVQDGEFVGWFTKTNLTRLQSMELESPLEYFNVRYLKRGASHLNTFVAKRTSAVNARSNRDSENNGVVDEVDLLNIYVRLVPKEWKLGKSETSELWLFVVAGNDLIVRAAPANLYHNMFPVGVMSYMGDSVSVCPISKLESIYELCIASNYGYASMLHEMRKSVHNRFVIDPMLARYDDATSDDPAQMIRIREGAWGRGVQNAIMQLQTTNVTKDNMQHISTFMDFAYNSTGATEAMQGVMRKRGERTTATEFRDTRMSAVGRVEKDILMASLQSMDDIAYMVYKHTQQFFSEDSFLSFTGQHAQELMMHYGTQGVMFTKADLYAEISVAAGDTSTYSGQFLNEQIQLFQMAMSNPETAMAFDFTRWMLDLTRRSGVSDPSNMLKSNIKALLMPTQDAQLLAQRLGEDAVPTNQLPSLPSGFGGVENGQRL